MGEVKALIESSTSSWNAHDRDQWNSAFTDNAELRGPGGVSGSGPKMASQFYGMWQDGFPDCQVAPAVISEDGENGMLEAVFRGTHTGPLNAPAGTVPPTGKAVEIPFVVAAKVRDGKFGSFHLYFDQAELMAQLGLA